MNDLKEIYDLSENAKVIILKYLILLKQTTLLLLELSGCPDK